MLHPRAARPTLWLKHRHRMLRLPVSRGLLWHIPLIRVRLLEAALNSLYHQKKAMGHKRLQYMAASPQQPTITIIITNPTRVQCFPRSQAFKLWVLQFSKVTSSSVRYQSSEPGFQRSKHLSGSKRNAPLIFKCHECRFLGFRR